MGIPGAKDDGLLVGTAGLKKHFEEVLAHSFYPVRQLNYIFKGRRLVSLTSLIGSECLPRGGVPCPQYLNILPGYPFYIEIHLLSDDFARRKITVFNPLRHVVFIDWFTKVFEIIGSYFFILPTFILGPSFKRTWGCGEPDLNRIWVLAQHETPFPPRASMTFINNDMAEIILGIILEEKPGIFRLSCHIKCLVGCNQDAGILLRLCCCYFGCISPEDILESTQGLGTQFIPVADK